VIFIAGKRMGMPEIYVSTDIETDGWHPGENSMLSLGSAAYFSDKTLIDTFTRNLDILPDAEPNPETMEWWKTQPEAWAACRQDCQPADKAILEYHQWLVDLPGQIIFVGEPVAFDYPMVTYYLNRFANDNPFGYRVIDIRSLAMGLLGCNYTESSKDSLPDEFNDDMPHSHIALDDAKEQGEIFCNLLIASQSQ
jgi:DNA polymerase III alpha subunit (gram-positive type)